MHTVALIQAKSPVRAVFNHKIVNLYFFTVFEHQHTAIFARMGKTQLLSVIRPHLHNIHICIRLCPICAGDWLSAEKIPFPVECSAACDRDIFSVFRINKRFFRIAIAVFARMDGRSRGNKKRYAAL